MSLICFHVYKMCSQLLNTVISRTSMIRHTVERNHEETRPPNQGDDGEKCISETCEPIVYSRRKLIRMSNGWLTV